MTEDEAPAERRDRGESESAAGSGDAPNTDSPAADRDRTDAWTDPDEDPVGEPGADGNGVDPDVRAAVTEDLGDLVGDDESTYPAMDDPIDPQRIDVEHAAFVVLGAVGMVALIAHMLVGLF